MSLGIGGDGDGYLEPGLRNRGISAGPSSSSSSSGGRLYAEPFNPLTLVTGHARAVHGLGTAAGNAASWSGCSGNADVFITCGADRRLLLWDAASRQVAVAVALPGVARSVGWHPGGACCAVGMDNGGFVVVSLGEWRGKVRGGLGDAKGGKLSAAVARTGGAAGVGGTAVKRGGSKIHRRPKVGVVVRRQDCVEAIDDIKYSPNGRLLAVASHDNFIDIYAVGSDPAMERGKDGDGDGNASYVLQARCEGHTSYVTHFDWSADSSTIQSNCGAYEIIYWRARDGKPLRSTLDTVESDTVWDSFTCVLGFPVMGVWPEDSDGTDINSLHVSADKNYVVTADDFGRCVRDREKWLGFVVCVCVCVLLVVVGLSWWWFEVVWFC